MFIQISPHNSWVHTLALAMWCCTVKFMAITTSIAGHNSKKSQIHMSRVIMSFIWLIYIYNFIYN